MEPDFGPDKYAMGLLQAEEGNYQEAAEYLKSASLLMNDNPRVFYNLGLILQNLGDFGEAEKVFTQGLGIDQNYWDLHNALMILYLQQELYSKAKFHHEILLKQFPNNQNLLELKGRLSSH